MDVIPFSCRTRLRLAHPVREMRVSLMRGLTMCNRLLVLSVSIRTICDPYFSFNCVLIRTRLVLASSTTSGSPTQPTLAWILGPLSTLDTSASSLAAPPRDALFALSLELAMH